MLDQNALSELVQKEIKNEIEQVVKQTNWADQIEQQVVRHVQDRITAKFSNIESMPDLIATVEKSVEKLFADGFVPDVSSFVNTKKLQKSVDIATENLVKETLDNLTIDPEWIKKIQDLVDRSMTDKISASIRSIDLVEQLKKIVLDNKDSLIDHMSSQFKSTGITDNSNSTQLTVLNDAVVVEGELYSNNLNIERDTVLKGDVQINGNLALLGKVNVDNRSWKELTENIQNDVYTKVVNDFSNNLVDEVIERSKQGIDFDTVSINGEQLVHNGKLSDGVSKLGTLDNLSISNTLDAKNSRVGINTESPDRALSVWEEEVSLSLGKHSKNTGYIGTSRSQSLVLGVNNDARLKLEKDGGVWVDKLTIGKYSISHGKSVPNYSGTKGDIVFNVDHKKGEPFAWMCLGAFRWQPLKAS